MKKKIFIISILISLLALSGCSGFINDRPIAAEGGGVYTLKTTNPTTGKTCELTAVSAKEATDIQVEVDENCAVKARAAKLTDSSIIQYLIESGLFQINSD